MVKAYCYNLFVKSYHKVATIHKSLECLFNSIKLAILNYSDYMVDILGLVYLFGCWDKEGIDRYPNYSCEE